MTKTQRALLPWLLGGAAVVVLTAGIRAAAGVLNPVLMAGFLALLLQPLVRRLNRLGVAGGGAVALVVFALILAGLALAGFVGISLRQVALEIPEYSARLEQISTSTTTMLEARGIDAAAYVQSALRGPQLGRTVLNATGAVAGAFGNMLLTLFIFAFMLGGMWEMERRASKRARDHSPLAAQFVEFSDTLRGYMAVRTVLGIVAAVLDYVVLVTLGVDYALLWGVLSFLLSFVPNIGFALSMLPPMLLALLEHGWVSALIVFVAYQVINTTIDNVIGPRFVGKQMNISALLSFLSVLFWTWLLGPTGAILAVPLTVLVRDLAESTADGPDATPTIIMPEDAARAQDAGPLILSEPG
jgi:predicted PurR-regulated permease PerM